MTSINNMNLFEVNENSIKSIIQTSITYYKIDEDSSKLLLDSISNKNNLELTVIEEDDEDIASVDNKITIKTEVNNIDENTKKEVLETEEEDINGKFTGNVNETIDDDQDLNSRMIKEITSDEINDEMIKDIDEEEEQEQEQEDIDEKENSKKEEEEKKQDEQNKK